MTKRILLLALLLVAALVWWAFHKKSQPPEVVFTTARRETLISNLITNGKAEPMVWQDVRVNNEGLVTRIPVKEGQAVSKGVLLAQLSEPGLNEDLRAAQAREEEAQAALDTLQQGGKSVELAQIDSDIEHARSDHEQALKDYNSLRRLHDKQAASTMDVEIAHAKLHDTEMALAALQKHRESLVSKQDVAAAAARVQENQAAVRLARDKISQRAVYAPIGGVVYNLPARPGTYLNPGDLVASIGNIDHLRVRVYVDEPELGRVRVDQPVKITWDGLPGRSWDGVVEKKAAEIVPLGTRQVGEVQVTIDNPNHELVPGANVNAEIRTNQVENALTIPKETMHRENGVVGVYLLVEEHVVWRPVKVGSASVTRAQILQGLQDSDHVALPSDHALRDGDPVRPIMQ